jgi:hypothetical protein
VSAGPGRASPEVGAPAIPPGQAQADRRPSLSRPVAHTRAGLSPRHCAVSARLTTSGLFPGVLVTIMVTRTGQLSEERSNVGHPHFSPRDARTQGSTARKGPGPLGALDAKGHPTGVAAWSAHGDHVVNRSISGQSRWVRSGGSFCGDRCETRCHDGSRRRHGPRRTARVAVLLHRSRHQHEPPAGGRRSGRPLSATKTSDEMSVPGRALSLARAIAIAQCPCVQPRRLSAHPKGQAWGYKLAPNIPVCADEAADASQAPPRSTATWRYDRALFRRSRAPRLAFTRQRPGVAMSSRRTGRLSWQTMRRAPGGVSDEGAIHGTSQHIP